MRKSSLCLLIATSLLFCLSVSASDVGEKSYTEPAFAMYAGYSGDAITVPGFEVTLHAYDMDVPRGTFIEGLYKLKPDKQTFEFIYTVIKPTNLAVMQNQNFDRVSVILT